MSKVKQSGSPTRPRPRPHHRTANHQTTQHNERQSSNSPRKSHPNKQPAEHDGVTDSRCVKSATPYNIPQ